MSKFNEYNDENMMQDITVMLQKQNGDICASGVNIAKKFATSDEDFKKIWNMIQDEFDIDRCGVNQSYVMDEKFFKEFAEHIAEMIKNNEFKKIKISEI